LATPAHAVAEHGVAQNPSTNPRRVDPGPDAGNCARPLMPKAHRVPRVPLVEIGHLAGEGLPKNDAVFIGPARFRQL
jgi:hypothetical protein